MGPPVLQLYSISSSFRMSDSSLDHSPDDKTCMAPHVLAMSATPIPRTLLYGDMSLTQITDLPPGRVSVETFTLEGNEIDLEKVYEVIEIGVDIPDASMMVVMNAERLGIAQLHQLRGRVGRGTRKSICIFVTATAGALDRLKVLEESSDGFYMANFDLLHRGPGNLLSKKQSGHLPEFPIARLKIDGIILQEAHMAALNIHKIENSNELVLGSL